MTDDKHDGLPVHGYRPQSPEAVALVNGFKEDEERLLRKLDQLSSANLHQPTGVRADEQLLLLTGGKSER